MLFFITVSVLVVSANAVVYKDCGSELATVQNVNVSGCAADAEVCELQRGINITFSMDFTPKKELTEVEVGIYGPRWRNGFITLNSPEGCLSFGTGKKCPLEPLPDACDTDLTCPLPAGKPVSLQKIVQMEMSWPQKTLPVQWRMLDDYEDIISCIMFTAKII